MSTTTACLVLVQWLLAGGHWPPTNKRDNDKIIVFLLNGQDMRWRQEMITVLPVLFESINVPLVVDPIHQATHVLSIGLYVVMIKSYVRSFDLSIKAYHSCQVIYALSVLQCDIISANESQCKYLHHWQQSISGDNYGGLMCHWKCANKRRFHYTFLWIVISFPSPPLYR